MLNETFYVIFKHRVGVQKKIEFHGMDLPKLSIFNNSTTKVEFILFSRRGGTFIPVMPDMRKYHHVVGRLPTLGSCKDSFIAII